MSCKCTFRIRRRSGESRWLRADYPARPEYLRGDPAGPIVMAAGALAARRFGLSCSQPFQWPEFKATVCLMEIDLRLRLQMSRGFSKV